MAYYVNVALMFLVQ